MSSAQIKIPYNSGNIVITITPERSIVQGEIDGQIVVELPLCGENINIVQKVMVDFWN
jgi:hypothetical protein